MDHLPRLGKSISIPIPADEDGFTGRECPQPDCKGYFKVQFGTGLEGEGLPCHCPYCGHTATHDQFWTKEQIEYAKSVALRKITHAIHKDLKKLEFEHKPKGPFGIGMSLEVKPGRRTPIHYYREKQLETPVVCDSCALRYSVYGVFAFCPDCGQHNSLQILDTNLEVVAKMLDLALEVEVEKPVAEKLVENALEDCVSAFDGFGRELCQVHANKARNPARVGKISFQNLENARSTILDEFGIDLSAMVEPDEWRVVATGFQKRHLVAHRMGVVDEDYIKKTPGTEAVVGRKVRIAEKEVRRVVQTVSDIARGLFGELHEMTTRDS